MLGRPKKWVSKCLKSEVKGKRIVVMIVIQKWTKMQLKTKLNDKEMLLAYSVGEIPTNRRMVNSFLKKKKGTVLACPRCQAIYGEKITENKRSIVANRG